MSLNVPLSEVCRFLEEFAPLSLAESWDNVGLLLGDRKGSVTRIMTCLTATPASVEEARREKVDLVVAHHPLPFQPLKRITSDTLPGRLVWELASAGIALYSPHTAFDSAAAGINERLAAGIGLAAIEPLNPADGENATLGSGRLGRFFEPISLSSLLERTKSFLRIERLQFAGSIDRDVSRVAVACGSGGSFLASAGERQCDVLLTGETNFHTALEAEARGMSLITAGHFATERFAVESLAEVLAKQFPSLTVWASREERDPLAWG